MNDTVETLPPRLGAYRVDSLLGRGGMGEVYLAWDERLHRHVAIKRIHPEATSSAKKRERFHREARAVARLSHPAIVQVYDVLELQEGDCLVMEYVEGRQLTELVMSRTLSLEEALNVAREVAEGLGEAHAKGLVHRDLKSENVIVTTAGHAKILDFGLARMLWQDGDGEPPSLTAPDMLVGTVHAMSPEQATGAPVDHRSDLFSLGVLVYEMASGVSPFRAKGTALTLQRIATEPPPPLGELLPGLPEALIRLVGRLLEKDPARRPQNARLVAAELAEIARLPGLPGTAAGRSLSGTATSVVSEDAPTVSGVAIPRLSPAPAEPSEAAPAPAVLKVLALVDLVESTRLVERLGDARASEVLGRHDRLARDLLARHEGLEIDKTDGFLLLFERPADAVAFALEYHHGLDRLGQELDLELAARSAVHLGEVLLRKNPAGDVARGAKPIEVEGLVKHVAARVMALAGERQVLLTRAVFDLARRGAVGGTLDDPNLEWLAHGAYALKGVDEPLEVFEVGVRGFAPLQAPPGNDKARRAVAVSDELTLGWRPAVRQTIPRRPNWRLEERLGEGGFGEVWLARHVSTGDPRVFKFCFEVSRLRALEREVTLFRLIRESLGEREDIARILDWSFEAAPYFLESEYTEGGNLADWCAERGGLAAVPLDERLEIVAQVAEALDAAHSVGILHKDVKPANVLIKSGTGMPRVRITDFGIGGLTDRDALSEHGITMLGFTETAPGLDTATGGGSLRYMAPELLEGKPASIQADLYSLGVLLYQVVVGDFGRALAPGWRREVEDELLVGDVELLVDGSPERRPRSALEVARRLRRLDERRRELAARRRAESEEAERRRREERAHRRRRVLAGVAVGVLVLLAALAIQSLFARRQADRLRGQAEGLVHFMLGDLYTPLEELGRLELLESVAKEVLDYCDGMASDELTDETRAIRAEALVQIGAISFQRDQLEEAGRIFQETLPEVEGLAARDPENDERQRLLALNHFWIANVRRMSNDLDGAVAALEDNMEITRRLAERNPGSEKWRFRLSETLYNLGYLDRVRHRLEEALGRFEESLEAVRDLVPRDPEREEWRTQEARVLLQIGDVMAKLGRLDEALAVQHKNLDLLEELLGRDPDNARWREYRAIVHNYLGLSYERLGRLVQAQEHHRRHLQLSEELVALEPEAARWQRHTVWGNLNLGRVLVRQGRVEEGLDHVEKALRVATQMATRAAANRQNQLLLVAARNTLSKALLSQGNLRGAKREVEGALALLESPPLAGDETLELRLELGESLLQMGRVRDASGQHREAEAAWGKALEALAGIAPESAGSLLLLDLRARILLHQGALEEARPVIERLLATGYRDGELLATCRAFGYPLPEAD